MNRQIREIFIELVIKSQLVTKQRIILFGDRFDLKLDNRMKKCDLINKISENGYFEEFYKEFNFLIYIPVWKVADFYKVNTKQIDKLQEVGFIKDKPSKVKFLNKEDNKFYYANTYCIDILRKYTTELINKAYDKVFGKLQYRTRIEVDRTNDFYELVQELEKNFEISNTIIYPQRNQGYYGYFNISTKKINNKDTTNLEMAKLKNRIKELEQEVCRLESLQKDNIR